LWLAPPINLKSIAYVKSTFLFAAFSPFALFALKNNDVHNQSALIFVESGPNQ